MTLNRPPELRAAVRRLTVQFTALMLLVVALLGGVVFAIVSRSAAEATTEALFEAAHVDSPKDAPMGTWVAVQRDGRIEASRDEIAGLPDRAALERANATREIVRTTVASDGRAFDVLTVKTDEGVVQVALDQHETREELDRLLWALLAAGGIAVVCSAVGSRWMARRAIQPLADALELQRRFVADASHELRTPLTVLSTRAQLARRRIVAANQPDGIGDDGNTLEDLDHLVEDAQKLTGILEDLLLAADTRSSPPLNAVDIATAARAAIAATSARAHQRSVQISSDLHGGATVIASQTAIERLFVALLDNAIDHAHSRVDVQVSVTGSTVTACVRDDGSGFSADSKARAFDRFATARGEAAPDAPRHYGIGLALVAEIAGRAGGSVRIDDSVSGASVLVDLPYQS